MESISLQEATTHYRVGIATLYRLLAAGQLTRYRRPHDRRTYLDRAELDRVFTLAPAPAREVAVARPTSKRAAATRRTKHRKPA